MTARLSLFVCVLAFHSLLIAQEESCECVDENIVAPTQEGACVAQSGEEPPPAYKQQTIDCNGSPRIYRFYSGHVFGSGPGFNQGYTTVNFFTAPRFVYNWLPFFDLRGHYFDDGKWAANGGAGFRYLHEPKNAFLGFNVFYDYRRYQKKNFNQVGAGIEWSGAWAGIRANGYLPVGEDKKIIGYSFDRFSGNNMLISEKAYLAMWGIDGEIDARLFAHRGAEVEMGVGAYYYKGDFGKDTVGGRVRVSMLYKKFLYASGTTTFDRLFHWRGQGEVGINIPFGPRLKKEQQTSSAVSTACSNDALLMRRLEAPVQRQEIIVVSKQHRPLTALDPVTGLPIVFYQVNNLSMVPGLGTFESPFQTLAQAQTASVSGDTVYVNYGNGSSFGYNAGFIMKDGQRLFGSAVDQVVNTSKGAITIPAQTPNQYPLITAAAGANIITLGNGSEVSGFNVFGGANGIIGTNLIDAPYIHNNMIFNTGVAAGAIDASIRLTWTTATFVSGTLRIENNMATLAFGAVAGQNHGVYIDFTTAAATTSQLDMLIQNNSLVANNPSGLVIEKTGTGTVNYTGTVYNNIISGNTNNGIHFNHAVGATAMNLTMSILNNQITGNATAAGNAGILSAGAAAAVNFTQGTLNIMNNTIANNANFAIDIQLTGTNILGSRNHNNVYFNNGTGARYITNTATNFLDLDFRNNTATGSATGYVFTRTAGTFTLHLSGNTGPMTASAGITLLP
jgi:hypothetical protein